MSLRRVSLNLKTEGEARKATAELVQEHKALGGSGTLTPAQRSDRSQAPGRLKEVSVPHAKLSVVAVYCVKRCRPRMSSGRSAPKAACPPES